jgi:hypothetical protein
MNSSQVPVARKEGLVIQEMPDEVLVYDLDTNKAHCLNQTAAFVWKSCNGRNSVADITKLVGDDSGNAVPEDLVWLAIDQLSEKNLLANNLKANFNGSTRREVIKKIGLAAVIGIPIVASLTAPPSALSFTSCRCGGDADCTAQPNCPTSCGGAGICVTPPAQPQRQPLKTGSRKN